MKLDPDAKKQPGKISGIYLGQVFAFGFVLGPGLSLTTSTTISDAFTRATRLQGTPFVAKEVNLSLEAAFTSRFQEVIAHHVSERLGCQDRIALFEIGIGLKWKGYVTKSILIPRVN